MGNTTSTKCAPAREPFASHLNRRVLLVPDAAAPDRHEAAIANIIGFAADWRPDEIILMGSHVSCRPCSMQAWRATGQRPAILAPWVPPLYDHQRLVSTLHRLRQAFTGAARLEGHARLPETERGLCDQNCDARLQELADLGVTCRPGPGEILPGWTAAYTRSWPGLPYPMAAIRLARILGRSIVCAGTAAFGAVTETYGSGAQRMTRWGIEIGGLRRANRTANGPRPLGFGVVEAVGNRIHAEPVAVKADGSFVPPSRVVS
ncbi:hypothetical protein AB0I28_33395 [Phytomonospora sp. NPDC050363]|uniref:hypothetical protein n=1 Tax=Phytomonospora sp. NPDC050363 TaxID=3155642 RepID=UPI0033E85A62